MASNKSETQRQRSHQKSPRNLHNDLNGTFEHVHRECDAVEHRLEEVAAAQVLPETDDSLLEWYVDIMSSMSLSITEDESLSLLPHFSHGDLPVTNGKTSTSSPRYCSNVTYQHDQLAPFENGTQVVAAPAKRHRRPRNIGVSSRKRAAGARGYKPKQTARSYAKLHSVDSENATDSTLPPQSVGSTVHRAYRVIRKRLAGLKRIFRVDRRVHEEEDLCTRTRTRCEDLGGLRDIPGMYNKLVITDSLVVHRRRMPQHLRMSLPRRKQAKHLNAALNETATSKGLRLKRRGHQRQYVVQQQKKKRKVTLGGWKKVIEPVTEYWRPEPKTRRR